MRDEVGGGVRGYGVGQRGGIVWGWGKKYIYICWIPHWQAACGGSPIWVYIRLHMGDGVLCTVVSGYCLVACMDDNSWGADWLTAGSNVF